MSYLVFARKYRPQTFDEIVGQEHIARNLKGAILSGRLAHAYIFSGPRGVGKTSCARILAKALNCKDAPTVKPCGACPACSEISQSRSLDVIEIDGASNRGIEDIRTLRENVKFGSTLGKYKIYIIDEVHQITSDGFNALLKTLEEPPAHVKFIFATTALNKVPLTIRSRCQRFEFRPISTKEIMSKLEEIMEKESLNIDKDALFVIAKAAEGSLRDAESILEQLSSFSEGRIGLKDVTFVLGAIEEELFVSLVDRIIAKDAAAALEITDDFLNQGKDAALFIARLIEYLRNLMIINTVKNDRDKFLDIPAHMRDAVTQQAGKFPLVEILNSINILITTQEMLRRIESQRIALEIGIVRLCGGFKTTHNSSVSAAEPAPLAKKEPDPPVLKENEDAPQKTATLNDALGIWQAVIDGIAKTRMSLATYLNESVVSNVENNIMTVIFPGELKFHKEALEKKENKEFIEKNFSEKLNTKIKLNFMLSDKPAPNPEDMIEPAIKSKIEVFKGKIVGKSRKG